MFQGCNEGFTKVDRGVTKKGNGIFQTGNGIIASTSRPLIKNHLLQNVFLFLLRSSKMIFKIGDGILQAEKGIISPTSMRLIKNFFYNMFLHFTKALKIKFQSWKRIYLNRKCNYFFYFQASDEKLLLLNVPHF